MGSYMVEAIVDSSLYTSIRICTVIEYQAAICRILSSCHLLFCRLTILIDEFYYLKGELILLQASSCQHLLTIECIVASCFIGIVESVALYDIAILL